MKGDFGARWVSGTAQPGVTDPESVVLPLHYSPV